MKLDNIGSAFWSIPCKAFLRLNTSPSAQKKGAAIPIYNFASDINPLSEEPDINLITGIERVYANAGVIILHIVFIIFAYFTADFILFYYRLRSFEIRRW